MQTIQIKQDKTSSSFYDKKKVLRKNDFFNFSQFKCIFGFYITFGVLQVFVHVNDLQRLQSQSSFQREFLCLKRLHWTLLVTSSGITKLQSRFYWLELKHILCDRLRGRTFLSGAKSQLTNQSRLASGFRQRVKRGAAAV